MISKDAQMAVTTMRALDGLEVRPQRRRTVFEKSMALDECRVVVGLHRSQEK